MSRSLSRISVPGLKIRGASGHQPPTPSWRGAGGGGAGKITIVTTPHPGNGQGCHAGAPTQRPPSPGAGLP